MKSKKQTYNIYIASWIIVIITILLTCSGCDKNSSVKSNDNEFEINKDYPRGPLTVHVRVDKAKVTIAETILLELEAIVEEGFEVKMPTIDKVLTNFGIVDWDNVGDKLDENNNVASLYRYRLEPFLSGTYSLPSFKFEFYDVNSPEDKKYELETEPVEIEVISLFGEQRGELKIADIESVVEVSSKPSYWWIWFFVLVVIIIAIVLWLNKRKHKTRELIRIFKSAHEIAYERLRILVEKDLIKSGKIKEFYEEISNILRHYIEHRFNLRAPERTTEEFLAELTSVNTLDEQNKGHLTEFLRHCDLVKFAKYDPTTEQIQKTFDLVKDFIETTKSNEKKIDVTKNESKQAVDVVSV